MRKYLAWADITRADVFADDETRRQINFHDLRHTGITWRAVRGDEPLKTQRAAGHDDLRTTQRYINEAQTFEGASFGTPFPEVPMGLLTRFGAEPRVSARMMPPPLVFSDNERRPQRDTKMNRGPVAALFIACAAELSPSGRRRRRAA